MRRRSGRTPSVRPPAAAGTFYPADPARLGRLVDELLGTAAARTQADGVRPLALVVPHAGYRYSGAVAAAASVRLGDAPPPARVVLLGPAHFVPSVGLTVSAADAWSTPLGEVSVDGEARAAVLGVPEVRLDDRPHVPEHSLEVQLPFLQRVWEQPVPVLPVAVHAAPEPVADLIDAVRALQDTLVVVSTDLSHYLTQEGARLRDQRTAAAVVRAEVAAVGDRDACGADALRGLLAWVRRGGSRVEQIALTTSGDVTGDRTRVVGYGAVWVGRGGSPPSRRPPWHPLARPVTSPARPARHVARPPVVAARPARRCRRFVGNSPRSFSNERDRGRPAAGRRRP